MRHLLNFLWQEWEGLQVEENGFGSALTDSGL